MADMKLVKQFTATMKEANKRTEPYDTPAEVVRIEGNTAWVHIPGGVDETPVQLTVSAQEGDIVQVRVGGGSAWITGNATAPPTDDKVAIVAQATAEEALRAAGYYISSDGTGVMIADMKEGGRETPSTATKKNVRIDEDSVDVRDGQTVLASFGDTSVIGKDTGSRLVIDNNSLEMVGPGTEGSYAFIGDLRGSDGRADITEDFIGDGDETQFQVSFNVASVTSVKINNTATTAYTRSGRTFTFNTAPAATADIEINYRTASANAKAYTLGRRGNGNIGGMSVAENSDCIATAHYSHAEGLATEASGKKSHAEGEGTMARGEASHAEGFLGMADGKYSHAGGYSSHAYGTGAFAHGRAARAEGNYSAAFGENTEATGSCSHAEGYNTTARGAYSHSSGLGTEARGQAQTVVGKYNDKDYDEKYLFIVGNGTSTLGSNAFAVDRSGNVVASGDITDGSGNTLSSLLSGLVKIVEYSYAYTNLAAGAGLSISANDFNASVPSGYTAAAVLMCNSGSAANCSVTYFNGAATTTNPMMRIVNTSSSARSYTARIRVLYVRTSAIAS